MANFCTNCGTKLGRDDNFCTNCGTKIDKTDMRENNNSLNSIPDSIEKRKARTELKRVVGGGLLPNRNFTETLIHNGLDADTGEAIKKQVQKEIESGRITTGGVEIRVNQLIVEHKARMENEKEEKNKKIRMIDEIFESEEIKSEIRANKNNPLDVTSIRDDLEDKLIDKRENMGVDEIRYFIKSELKKAKEQENARIAKEKEMSSKKIEVNENYKGYCNFSCIHHREQYISADGGTVGFDFTGEEIVDYYCALGHDLVHGSFCKDYEG